MNRKMSFALLTAAVMAMAPTLASATPPHCPPGHAKKGLCTPGPHYDARHAPRDIVIIRDYDRYGLHAPRDGYYYGILNEEVFLISRATQEIIEGIGAVGYLLNR